MSSSVPKPNFNEWAILGVRLGWMSKNQLAIKGATKVVTPTYVISPSLGIPTTQYYSNTVNNYFDSNQKSRLLDMLSKWQRRANFRTRLRSPKPLTDAMWMIRKRIWSDSISAFWAFSLCAASWTQSPGGLRSISILYTSLSMHVQHYFKRGLCIRFYCSRFTHSISGCELCQQLHAIKLVIRWRSFVQYTHMHVARNCNHGNLSSSFQSTESMATNMRMWKC